MGKARQSQRRNRRTAEKAQQRKRRRKQRRQTETRPAKPAPLSAADQFLETMRRNAERARRMEPSTEHYREQAADLRRRGDTDIADLILMSTENDSEGSERCVYLGEFKPRSRQLGESIYKAHGDHGLQRAIGLVPRFDRCELNLAWDGIGMWRA